MTRLLEIWPLTLLAVMTIGGLVAHWMGWLS